MLHVNQLRSNLCVRCTAEQLDGWRSYAARQQTDLSAVARALLDDAKQHGLGERVRGALGLRKGDGS